MTTGKVVDHPTKTKREKLRKMFIDELLDFARTADDWQIEKMLRVTRLIRLHARLKKQGIKADLFYDSDGLVAGVMIEGGLKK
jgi:arginine decarboxylase-like protein